MNNWEKGMAMLARALGDHLKEVAWALFLIFVFVGCLFLSLEGIWDMELLFGSVSALC